MRNPELDTDLPPVNLAECGTNDRILYATWLAIAALVGAAALVAWRVVR